MKRLAMAVLVTLACVGCGATGDALAQAEKMYEQGYGVTPTPEQLDVFMDINGL